MTRPAPFAGGAQTRHRAALLPSVRAAIGAGPVDDAERGPGPDAGTVGRRSKGDRPLRRQDAGQARDIRRAGGEIVRGVGVPLDGDAAPAASMGGRGQAGRRGNSRAVTVEVHAP